MATNNMTHEQKGDLAFSRGNYRAAYNHYGSASCALRWQDGMESYKSEGARLHELKAACARALTRDMANGGQAVGVMA